MAISTKKLVFLLLMLAASACQPDRDRQATRPGDSTRVQAPPRYTPFEECPRGVPAPILSPASFPKRRFRLEPDSGWARESTPLRKADSLVVLHTGCATPVTRFRLYLYLPMPDTAASPLKLYGKALPILHQVLDGMEQPDTYRQGIKALGQQIAHGRLKLGEAYEYGVLEPGGAVHTVAVQEVHPLPGKRLVVVVEFGQQRIENNEQ